MIARQHVPQLSKGQGPPQQLIRWHKNRPRQETRYNLATEWARWLSSTQDKIAKWQRPSLRKRMTTYRALYVLPHSLDRRWPLEGPSTGLLTTCCTRWWTGKTTPGCSWTSVLHGGRLGGARKATCAAMHILHKILKFWKGDRIYKATNSGQIYKKCLNKIPF